MKLFTKYLKPYYPKMAFGFLIKFIGTIMDLLLPAILAHIIDNVIGSENFKKLIAWGLVMLACSVLALVTNIFANRMASLVARDSTKVIRDDLFEKIMYLPSRDLDRITVPSLISRMTADTYNIHRFTGLMQRIGIRAPILLIGGLLVTLTLDPVLTLVLLVTLLLLSFIVFFVSSKGIPMFKKVQESTDNMVRVLRENITGVRVIKALSKSDYEIDRFDETNKQVIKDETKTNMVLNTIGPTMNLLLQTGIVAVIVIGAFRVNAGHTEVGKIMAFLTYFTIILYAMMAITRIFTMASRAISSASRVMEVLDTDTGMGLTDSKIDEQKKDYHISFDKLSFSYNKMAMDLEDISFDLKEGESLGIIGATGSGKSTLVKLLMGFYYPDKGQIRIFGQDIRSMPLKELRDMFGVVFQNDALFRDTISENIRLGRDIEEDDIIRALGHAQANYAIDKGLDFGLSIKGANLSGGQKQRLLIARALANKPKILILDDSSSALDYKTDASLRKDIRENYEGVTSIIIAQRISSIKHADHILVLDQGKIAGFGNHQTLIKSNDLYREIAMIQMGEIMDEN